MGVPITFLDNYSPDQFTILNANDYRLGDTAAKPHGLIKDKDATITTAAVSINQSINQSISQSINQDAHNVCSHHHQTCCHQELTAGTSMVKRSTRASSYNDMVSRPICNGREVYRRIFVTQKFERR
jgi:hypothetical protein